MACLGDYIKIKHGYAFKGEFINTDDNGSVLVTPGNFEIGGGFKQDKCKFYHSSDYPEEYILKPDDLVVTMTDLSKEIDTLGYSALIPYSKERVYLHNQRIGLVIIKSDEIDKHYLYWFMRTPYYQKRVAASSSGSTVHHTSPDRICQIEINLPPLEVQKKIAFFLDVLENKVNNNLAIIENLEHQLRLIFKNEFSEKIDFYNGVFKPLSDLIDVVDNRGKTPPLEKNKTDYPLIDVKTLSGESRVIDYDKSSKYVSYQTYKEWFRNGHPKKYDTLISTVGSVAEMKLFLQEKGSIAQNVVAFRTKEISPLYLYQYLNYIRGDLIAYNIGSVQPSIKVTHILKHKIYIPTELEIKKFDSFANDATNIIFENTIQNERIKNIIKIMLPKIIFGEIDVKNIEI